jgi:signal transduction histidine kinase
MTSTPIDRPAGGETALSGPGRALGRVRASAAWARRTLTGPDGPVAVALVLAGVAILEVNVYRDGAERGTTIALNLAATLPVALAHRHPRLVAAAITGVAIVLISQPEPRITGAAVAGLLVADHLVALRQPRWVSAALALPFVVNAIDPLGANASTSGAGALLALVVAALVLGDLERQRGAAIAERDATREAMAESLHDRAVMAERARIAHELHDIVAHHISMISVQAEAARLTTPGMPPEGRTRLAEIGDTARGAMDEMRRLLGVLRGDDREAAARVPQPGLAQLDDLIDTARSAGTPVRHVLEGTTVPLPQAVDLAAYRIVQESLTNARTHAPGAAVTVELRYGADALGLRVRDDGPGPRSAAWDARPAGGRGQGGRGGGGGGGGHGLVGMAERAALVGGSLHAGPGADGVGFVVEASLPLLRARDEGDSGVVRDHAGDGDDTGEGRVPG